MLGGLFHWHNVRGGGGLARASFHVFSQCAEHVRHVSTGVGAGAVAVAVLPLAFHALNASRSAFALASRSSRAFSLALAFSFSAFTADLAVPLTALRTSAGLAPAFSASRSRSTALILEAPPIFAARLASLRASMRARQSVFLFISLSKWSKVKFRVALCIQMDMLPSFG